MRTRFLWILGTVVAFTVTAPAFAFDLPKLLGGTGDERNSDTFKIIHIAELASMMSDKTPNLHIYDANGPDTREKFGVIPGRSDALIRRCLQHGASTLPAQKNDPLVFYCADIH